MKIRALVVLSTAFGLLIAPEPASADDPSQFYKDREIKIVIGSAPGGGYDTYSRLLMKHMGRFIPGGTAQIMTINMPGAGGIRAANWLDTIGPKDGSAMIILRRGLPIYQVLGGRALTVNLAGMNWICDLSDSPPVLVTWHTSPVKTIDDARKQKTTVGGSGGDSMTSQLSLAYNQLLGTQLEPITGYQGGAEVNLAIERGELAGRATNNLASWKTVKPDWIAENKLNFLMQLALKRDPDLPETPLLMELVKGDAEKEAVARFLTLGNTLGRPLGVHRDVPKERVEVLRTACEKTLADPEFRSQAIGQGAEFSFRPGNEVQALLQEFANTPAVTIDKVKQYINYKEEEIKQ